MKKSFFSRWRKPAVRIPAGRSLLIEGLEGRRLLAADLVASLDNGVLEVVGTKKADAITVNLSTTVTGQLDVLSGAVIKQSFTAAEVTSIRIEGKGGNDVIVVDPTITVPVTVEGDGGNDTITGGGGDDDLNGDAGNDTINGSAGDDNCSGGSGNDTVNGGDDNDLIRGDAGKDDLNGGTGDDNCDGGASNDDVSGDDDNDFLTGGSGKDVVSGGLGDDDIDGGSGNDDVNGDDGNDRVRGGSGSDDVDGGANDDVIRGDSGKDKLTGGEGSDSFDDNEDNEKSSDRGEGDVSDNSQHLTLADLPAPVVTAFNTQFPGAKIREIESETEESVVVYKIDYLNTAGVRQRAVFDAAGTLLRNGGKGGHDDDGGGQQITTNDLPTAVQTAFNTDFPGSTIGEIEREVEDEGTIFKIDFTDAATIRKRAEYTEAGVLKDVDLR